VPRRLPSAVWKFAISGLAVLLLIVAAGVFILDRVAEDEAIDNAREITRLAAHGAIEPNLTDGVLTGEPTSLARLDKIVRTRVLSGSVVSVKLWSRDGRLISSDEPQLIGERRTDTTDADALITSGAVKAQVADLSRSENRFDRDNGKLLEVNTTVRTPSGEPVVFELYRSYSSVASEARDAWWAFGLVALGGLVALWLIQLPLALGLARRLRRGQEDREQLLIRAIDASDAERRRIASDLHDGVVQDLAGLSFSLAAAADRATARGAVESSEILDRAAASARRAVRQMRSLLVDIYPPNLHTVGLESALRDLLSPLQAQGIASNLDVSPDLRLAPATERLLFVTAREAIRNVARHADAHAASVRVATDGTRVELVVDDDGRGFPADEVLAKGPNGHLGLALLTDLAHRAGGDLAVVSRDGEGTRLTLGVPSS
jgi:two-component system, NarL family, sensor kinase